MKSVGVKQLRPASPSTSAWSGPGKPCSSPTVTKSLPNSVQRTGRGRLRCRSRRDCRLWPRRANSPALACRRVTGPGRSRGSGCPRGQRPGCSTRFVAIGSDPASRTPLYLDTSAVLRATLEGGTSPEIERRIRSARPRVLASFPGGVMPGTHQGARTRCGWGGPARRCRARPRCDLGQVRAVGDHPPGL